MRNAKEQVIKDTYEGKLVHMKILYIEPVYDENEVKIEAEIIETDKRIEFIIQY